MAQRGKLFALGLAWALFFGNALAGPLDLSGQFAVSPSGAATYTIPLQVPPGTAGMEPKLALSYSSQSGNGWLGVGWSLSGFSAITRCPRTIAQDGVKGSINLDANDRFCIDGQRLNVISGTYGAASSEYRTELDSFSKITAVGGSTGNPASFKVWTKSGQILEYGNTTDSNVPAMGSTITRVWAVNKISDRANGSQGNYLTFSYYNDAVNGGYFPTRIDYTANDTTSLASNSSVQITYEVRPDYQADYAPLNLVIDPFRVTHIKTYLGSTLVKDYQFTYQMSPSTDRSRLTNIKACDASGNCLPPITMAFQDPSLGPQNWTYTGGQGVAYGGWRTANLFGDGRSLYISKGSSTDFYATRLNSDGTLQNISWSGGNGIGYGNQWDTGDFFGDGRQVYFTKGSSTDFYVTRLNSDGSLQNISWTGGHGIGAGGWKLADLFGDGRQVYYTVGSSADHHATRLNSDGTLSNYTWSGNGIGYGGWKVADIFGEGRQLYITKGSSTDFYADRLNIDGSSQSWSWSGGQGIGAGGWQMADLFGDGRQLYFTLDGQGNFYATRLNPDQTVQNFSWYVASAGIGPGGWQMADVFGEGRSCYYTSTSDGHHIVIRFNPDGTTHAYNWSGGNGIGGSGWQIADPFGDGRQLYYTTTSGTHYLTRLASLPSDIVTGFTTGLGQTATISYTSLAQGAYSKGSGSTYPTLDLQVPMYAVSQVQSSNGVGGSLTTNYYYGSLKADLTGRGILGFGGVTATQVDTGIVTQTYYNQTWPIVGTVGSSIKTHPSASGPSHQLNLVNNYYNCSDFSVGSGCTAGTNKRYFPYLKTSVESSWDFNGATLPVVTTTNTFDCESSPTACYGNVTTVAVNTSDGYSKTTTNTYKTADTTNWILGRLVRSSVASTTPSSGGGSGGTSSAPTTLAIVAADADKAEGNSGTTAFTFTVMRNGNTSGSSSATWTVSGSGSNTANATDFVGGSLPTGTVSFAANETSKTVTVNVQGDTTAESDETFTVTLSSPSSGTSIAVASAIGTIRDDDGAPTLSIVTATADQAEGNSGTTAFTFTVTRSGANTSGSSSATWTVSGSGINPANATDFVGGTLPTGTVSFTTGQTSQTVTVNVQGDATVEPDETFTVTLSAPSSAVIGVATAIGVIRDDDGPPTLSIAALDADHAEGNTGNSPSTPFTFTVTRSGTSSGASSANWAVTGSGGNPAVAADFANGVLPSGVVTFMAGQTSQVITVPVYGDTTAESDKGFTVTLANPSNAGISTATANGTIRDDDSATTLTIAANAADKPEGNSGTTAFTFTVTRSGITTGTSTATWTVTGSGANPANATDFVGGSLPTGTVTFTSGQTSQTVTVNVQGDATVESDETFTVTLSGPSSGTLIAVASAAGTIRDDDGSTTLAIAPLVADQAEGNSAAMPFTFTVTRSGNATGTSSATWTVSGSSGNPANATDFVGGSFPTGTVSFAANETSKVVTVNVQGDTTPELDEGFTVTLSSPSGATITTATATGTVRNDDAGITSVSPNGGPTAGGTAITVSGYFVNGASISIGGVAATGCSLSNATTMNCTTAAGSAGAKNVVLTQPGGSATLTNGYTYYAPPTISVSRVPSPMVAGQSNTVTWSSTNATSVAYNCTGGYTASGTVGTVNGSSTGTFPYSYNGTTCVWTATGQGGSANTSETWTIIPSFSFNATIAAQTTNYNLRSAAIAAGWNQTDVLIATVTINSGVYVGSGSISTPAFDTGASFPSGSTLALVNNGYIVGMGGAAGAGGYYSSGGAGSAGGLALKAQAALSVTNNGTVGGGGGGGGGGGDYYISDWWGMVELSGGGGGGGRGLNTGGGGAYTAIAGGGNGGANGSTTSAGAGGTGEISGSNDGGAGGGLGSAGSAGMSSSYPGGAGGAAGACTSGNGYITWTATGTRYGALN